MLEGWPWKMETVGTLLYIVDADGKLVCDLSLSFNENKEVAIKNAELIVKTINDYGRPQ